MNVAQRIEARLQRMRVVMATSKSARALLTEKSYVGWMRRYLTFSFAQPDCLTTPQEAIAQRFVEAHAREWSVATQDQFRNALVFYFKHVAERPLGDLGPWAQARRPKRLPSWLPHDQMMKLLDCLRGEAQLMAQLSYGSGIRHSEIVHLRWKDINFQQAQIVVREGKGDKDRATFLPQSLIEPLQQHRDRMRRLWEYDRRHGRPAVEVPSVKFNGTDWPWFWVFAARGESRDPRSGIVRRHHLHRSALGKALSRAVRIAGFDQRVTVHALRHSFATVMLMRGLPIHELKDLLGHQSIETTEVYLHCLPRLTARRGSPLDQPKVSPLDAHPNVLAFAAPEQLVHQSVRRQA